jgi:hypothetical protein
MVRFSSFITLDPETADLARELISATDSQRSAFSSFVNVWLAFNGWMESVTDADTDADMISALANHQRMVNAYDGLMAHSSEFRDLVEFFATGWPVLNVRDVRRKLGRDAFWRLSPDDLMEEVVRRDVKRQPFHWDVGNEVTWPLLLRAVYCIRCNLFHGSKSPQNFRDHQLVVSCDRILRTFIERTGCFEWAD